MLSVINSNINSFHSSASAGDHHNRQEYRHDHLPDLEERTVHMMDIYENGDCFDQKRIILNVGGVKHGKRFFSDRC